MQLLVYRPNFIQFPEEATLKRSPPRTPGQCEDGYVEKFDSQTVFYDAFVEGDDVIAVAPPMREYRFLLEDGSISFDDVPSTGLCERTQLDRVDVVKFSLPKHGQSLRLATEEYSANIIISKNLSNLFEGKNVVFTMSKNNDLTWIVDWATFYNRIHGVNAVLIYDNGSSIYSEDQIIEALSKVAGLETVVVVSWPFKYGPLSAPKGGRRKRFDSNFCQLASMEHARRLFLSSANYVINCDIDELVVILDDVRLIDHLRESDNKYLLFSGLWVHVDKQIDRVSKHSDYVMVSEKSISKNTKWVVDPKELHKSSQWMVHYITGLPVEEVEDVKLRHFRGINTNWQFGRTNVTEEKDDLQPDIYLQRDYLISFPEV